MSSAPSDRPSRGTERRRSALRAGTEAEQAVEDWYVRRGFRVLARNHQVGGAELDRVMIRDGDLRVVEVKQRGKGDPTLWESVDRRKRRRLVRAAEAFMQSFTEPYTCVSMDVALVAGSRGDWTIEVLESAFDGG